MCELTETMLAISHSTLKENDCLAWWEKNRNDFCSSLKLDKTLFNLLATEKFVS